MDEKRHVFASPEITVTWSRRRCTHVAECLRGLPAVFEAGRVPWIAPERAPADQVAEVVLRCPTGALHYQRHDGGAAEPVPATNTVVLDPDGPLYLSGDVELAAADGTVVFRDTRVALCRCGYTRNRPFCDASHWTAGFEDEGALGEGGTPAGGDAAAAGPLKVAFGAGGPLYLEGRFVLAGADGARRELDGAELCRCGVSRNRPFCDGSHTGTSLKEG